MLMAEKKVAAPSGMAGLVRYFEEEKSIIKMKPEHVVAICAGIIVLEIILWVAFRNLMVV